MAMTMYKIEEGKVAPRVPEFLRGKFFELYNPDNEVIRDHAFGPEYVGWVHFRDDGTIEFGEPGA